MKEGRTCVDQASDSSAVQCGFKDIDIGKFSVCEIPGNGLFLRASAESFLEASESPAGGSLSGDSAGKKKFSALTRDRSVGCDRFL